VAEHISKLFTLPLLLPLPACFATRVMELFDSHKSICMMGLSFANNNEMSPLYKSQLLTSFASQDNMTMARNCLESRCFFDEKSIRKQQRERSRGRRSENKYAHFITNHNQMLEVVGKISLYGEQQKLASQLSWQFSGLLTSLN
jgi:hypothetical protein